ncbi:helix-turn-helix domain-containing protein, partial [Streptomyces sp. NPDC002491]
MTTATLEPRAGRRCQSPLNSLHAAHYFSPDLARELGALGITHPRAVNFAARAAALGPVGAGAVTAAFYNYKHDVVARHVPAVWSLAAPAQILPAR